MALPPRELEQFDSSPARQGGDILTPTKSRTDEIPILTGGV
jgi:hypothetical protein